MPKRRPLALAIAQLLALPAAQAATITVDSINDGATADDGICTLREAIISANTDSATGGCTAGSGADAIQFDLASPDTAQIILLNQGQMSITAPLTITGPGRDLLTIDADAKSRHLQIDDGNPANIISVAISDISLVNGEVGEVTDASGGAINTVENLSLSRATLAGNTVLGGGGDSSLGRGGALHASADGQPGLTLALDDVRIENNQARIGGGLSIFMARASAPANVIIQSSVIDGNRARPSNPVASGRAGADISVPDGSSVNIRDTVISNNDAQATNTANVGGAQLSARAGSSVLLERLDVLNNRAGGDFSSGNSGGLDLSINGDGASSSMRLVDSIITGNEAVNGTTGGLRFSVDGAGVFEIERSTISDNTAGGSRGGAYLGVEGGTIRVIESTISGNTAGSRAGGIDAYAYIGYSSGQPGLIEIQRSTITGNTAGNGGGIVVNSSSNGTLRLEGSIVAGNTANTAPDLDADLGGDMELDIATSLLGDNAGSGLTEAQPGSPDVFGNLIGDSNGVGVINPWLDALAINGGRTKTHLPLDASPAVDAAGICTGEDQRGQTRPQGAACDMGSVEVESNDTPVLSINPLSLSFGDVVIDQVSEAQTVILENTGTANLTLGTLALSGNHAAAFALSADNCSSQTLTPTANCTIEVTLTPTVTGTRVAQINIPSDAANSTNTLSLSGTGVQAQIALAPDPLDFGTALVGSRSNSQSVTVSNTGSAPLTVSAIDAPVTPFALTDSSCGQLPFTVAVNGNCTLAFTFSPTAAETASQTITVTSNPEAAGDNRLSLKGNGAPAPEVLIMPRPLDFGEVDLNVTKNEMLIIENTGAGNLAPGATSITGPQVGEFSIALNNCLAAQLAENEFCGISIDFTPTAPGVREATLSLESNALSSPDIVTLRGSNDVLFYDGFEPQ